MMIFFSQSNDWKKETVKVNPMLRPKKKVNPMREGEVDGHGWMESRVLCVYTDKNSYSESQITREFWILLVLLVLGSSSVVILLLLKV